MLWPVDDDDIVIEDDRRTLRAENAAPLLRPPLSILVVFVVDRPNDQHLMRPPRWKDMTTKGAAHRGPLHLFLWQRIVLAAAVAAAAAVLVVVPPKKQRADVVVVTSNMHNKHQSVRGPQKTKRSLS
jgi:hypothetical protein